MGKSYGKLNAGALSELCAQLGIFLHAGVSLTEGLELLRGETGSRRIKHTADMLAVAVNARKPLSEAMEECGLFPDYLVRMTKAGETAGNLDNVMESMSRFYERERRLREQIRSAVVYPLLLIIMMGVAVCFIITRVLPMFQDILTDLGGQLPGFVLALMNAGIFVERNYIIILAALVALVLICLMLTRTKKGVLFFDKCKARLPLCRKLAAARFASAMSFLLEGGVPMDSALELGSDMLGNTYMAQCLEQARRSTSSLGEVLEASGVFPEKFTKMFLVGVVSGEGDTAMGRLADIYETESSRAMDRFAGSIEPVLSALLSAIVGVILVSVILPLIRIMSLIG